MRRTTVYYVGGEEAKYTLTKWLCLQTALRKFHANFYNGEDVYVCSPRGVHELQTFAVFRSDQKTLVTAEKTALSWFFHGVRSTWDD